MPRSLLLKLYLLAMMFVGCNVFVGCSRQAGSNKGSDQATAADDSKDTTPDDISAEPESTPTVKGDTIRSAADSGSKSNVEFSASLLSWNVESEGNDPEVIARELAEMVAKDYDIVGLVEVHPDNFKRYEDALGGEFRSVRTATGFNDRMMILYDSAKYELVRQMELNDINFERRYRSPLVAHLKDRKTGIEFLVLNNHLARGKAEIRQQQAQQLVDWARDQTLPLLAIGDYNFDFEFATEKGNEAFNIFLRDKIYRWVRPEELIDSNWYDPEPDGVDNFPGSILDFCFLAGPATDWLANSRVIVRDGDFPDDEKRSDHRPIDLTVKVAVQ